MVHLPFHLCQIVRMSPVSGAQRPYDSGRATEAVPEFGILDHFSCSTWQIPQNALAAKHKRTLRAAEHLAALTTPATVQFAAVFSLVKLSAVVELVAVPTYCDTQNRMYTNRRFAGRSGTNMQIASGAV